MQTIRDGNRKVGYIEEGNGAPVVLLHSSGFCHSQWRAPLAELAGEYCAIAPDLLGYGATGPWTGGCQSLSDEVAYLAIFLRKLDRPAHLVGHSYGGGVALRAAFELGARLKSLTLVEPTAFHLLKQDQAEDDSLFAEAHRLASRTISAVETGETESGAEIFVDYWNGAGTWSGLPEEKRSPIRGFMPKIANDFRALFGEPVAMEEYSRVNVPTLVLAGSHSPAPVRALGRIVARSLPRCRHRTVPYAGHLLPLTHKKAFYAALKEHLRDIDEADTRHAA